MSTQPVTALAVIETLTPAKLFEPGVMDPILDRIKAEVRSVSTDISTESGRKEIASLAFKVARSKTFVDAQRKALVADEKKRLAVIDKEGKRIWDELEGLQHEVRKPLTDWENAEKARIEAHEAALRELAASGPYTAQNWQTLPVETMEDRMHEIEQDPRDWQEFAQRAGIARYDAITAITYAIAKRNTWDAERAELDRLRREQAAREQKERDEQIAAEAKAKADREAQEREERLRKEKEEAERRAATAEQERLAAIAKADADAVEAAKRAEAAKQAAVQRERERAEQEKRDAEAAEAKREANRRHSAKINREAVAALVANGMGEEPAKQAVTIIAKGLVPNVKISY